MPNGFLKRLMKPRELMDLGLLLALGGGAAFLGSFINQITSVMIAGESVASLGVLAYVVGYVMNLMRR